MTTRFPSLRFSVSVLVLISLLSSCKKVGELEKNDGNEIAPTDYPIQGFSSNDGVLASVRTVNFLRTDTGEIKIPGNYVAAYFYSKGSIAPFLDAGEVTIDTVDLQMDADKVYEVPFGASYPYGYASGDTVNWRVTGDAENEINPIAVTLIGYPDQPYMDTVVFSAKRSESFRLKMLNTLNNTEPTINTTVYNVFAIKQGKTAVSHRLNAPSVEYIFPEGDMAVFSEGTATVEIGSYRARELQVAGKKVFVINGRLSTRKITIIK